VCVHAGCYILTPPAATMLKNLTLTAIVVLLPSLAAADENPAVESELLAASIKRHGEQVMPVLRKHCGECHGAETQEGELDLSQLEPNMEGTSAARWALVLGKILDGEMPPEDRPRLSEKEIDEVTGWIKAEMKRTGKHIEVREQYVKGNSVPHELLFDPKHAAEFASQVRVRRLSPSIYQAFLDDVGKNARGVAQPFTPPPGATFSDTGTPKIDEPTTQSLIRNALRMVEAMTDHKIENGEVVKVGWTPKEYLRLFDEKNPPTAEEIEAALRKHFDRVLNRQPTDDELKRFTGLLEKNIADAGRATGVRYTLAAAFLLPDAVYRWELGDGNAESEGRIRLTPREIAYALAYALTDKPPERSLMEAAEKGQLDDREGVEHAVRNMLANEKLSKPRILRFFREYFDYAKAEEVFKEKQEFSDHEARTLVDDTDRLIEHILERDKNVLAELLTTNESFVAYRTAEDIKEKRQKAIAEFNEKKKKDPEKYKDKEPRLPGRSVYESYSLDDFPDEQPTRLPKNERGGILTQPAWLVAWSKSDENDPIHRGKWVRERLLGGVVPDIPITVDAQLPDAPEQTLRQRIGVTKEEYCWQCHTYMNRVGLPFEIYDHFGRYREVEAVLDPEATEKNVDDKGRHQGEVYREVTIDASGGLEHVPDPEVTGDVSNAVEMMHHLAKSEYVEQVFVRHAFRYFMGRNENLGDGPSLQVIHTAYQENDGSFNELIVAMLTSDSFLYRVRK